MTELDSDLAVTLRAALVLPYVGPALRDLVTREPDGDLGPVPAPEPSR